jgi:hypothetical protein
VYRPPILRNSCAEATSASETRFRIDAPIVPTRATRIVALDSGAAAVVRRVAAQQWAGARFFTCDAPGALRADGNGNGNGNGSGNGRGGLGLRGLDGTPAHLAAELTGADVAVVVATVDDGAAAASAIGQACTARGIMTAGLILGEDRDVADAVSALRPHVRVLMVSADEDDVSEVLTALRV